MRTVTAYGSKVCYAAAGDIGEQPIGVGEETNYVDASGRTAKTL
jgi:hypothetical protein